MTDVEINTVDVLVIEVTPPHGPAVILDPVGKPGAAGADGFAGWTPVLGVVPDGSRRVERLIDFIGGEGTKPDSQIGKYVGSTGYVTLITDATDIRGMQGQTGPQGAQGDAGAVIIGEGTDILTGHGAPSDAIGIDNELYIDVDTGDLYKKLSGHWVLQASLKGPKGDKGDTGDQGDTGPQGAAGSAGATGATGAAGAKGDKGDTGDAGAAGSSGLSLHVGTGAPGSGLGVVGDSYIDGSSFNFYSKTGVSAWTLIGNIRGATGATGAAGADGATIHTGSGAPSSGLGADGDQYIDTSTFHLYGKSGGSWTDEGSIRGPAGADGAAGPTGAKGDKGDTGAQFIVGTGAPSSGLGNNGDQYLDSVSHHLYSKSAGSWTDNGALAGDKGDKGDTGDTGPAGADGAPGAPGATGATGAAGADGAPGATGATGAAGANGASFLTGSGVPSSGLGANGDTYLNETNGDLYGPKSGGAWGSVVGNLKGPTGATGSAGAAGARGSVWSTGSGAPTNGSPAGVTNGDFYLRQSNGEVYQYVSGAWADQGFSIQGPTGATGATGAAGSGGSALARMNYTFSSTTTNSDPGSGNIRFSVSATGANNDSFSVYIDLIDKDGNDQSAFLAALQPSDGARETTLYLTTATGFTADIQWHVLRVNAVTNKSGYYQLDVTSWRTAGYTPPGNAVAVALQFDTVAIRNRQSWFNMRNAESVGLPGHVIAAVTTRAVASHTCYMTPILIDQTLWLRNVVWEVNTAGGGDARFFIGRLITDTRNLYNLGTVFYQSALQSNSLGSTGQKVLTPSIIIPPGHYVAGLAFGTTTGSPVCQLFKSFISRGNPGLEPVIGPPTTYQQSTDWTNASDQTGTLTNVPAISMAPTTLSSTVLGALWNTPFLMFYGEAA